MKSNVKGCLKRFLLISSLINPWIVTHFQAQTVILLLLIFRFTYILPAINL